MIFQNAVGIGQSAAMGVVTVIATIVIATDVLVIYALAMHGREVVAPLKRAMRSTRPRTTTSSSPSSVRASAVRWPAH